MADRKASGRGRSVLLVAAIAAAVGFGMVALVMWSRQRGADAPQRAAVSEQAPSADVAAPTGAEGSAQATASPRAAASPRTAADENSTFFSIFGIDETEAAAGGMPQQPRDWVTTFAGVTVRLTLAALLAALLAFRPRRFALFYKRNPFVAQTQILLAVVASALMMIVGDSAARAFGIFAAVSLVRFRTNIKDPKEITVLLVSLAIGLATGVGRWELAVILAFFVLLLLWGLEYRERELVFRAMELTVKTKNVDVTQDILTRLFRRYNFDSEMRTVERPAEEGETGCIVYYVNVSPLVSTDRLSEEIFSTDSPNVEGVEWNQKKTAGLYYQ